VADLLLKSPGIDALMKDDEGHDAWFYADQTTNAHIIQALKPSI
jgi:hypothetical protein